MNGERTYNRTGRVHENPTLDMEAAAALPTRDANPEERIKVDGFGQVLAMLQVADPDFRDSLLRRIAARDRNLAAQLIRALSV